MSPPIDRRGWLKAAGAGLATLWLAACDRLNENKSVHGALRGAEELNLRAQRLLMGDRRALAREYPAAEISPDFRANGSIDPADPDYRALAAGGFADWRLAVGGLVARPMSLSLADLRALPARTQITRHDCVEGWSAIGKWSGVPLKLLLDLAGLRDSARYLVFRCADASRGVPYYESIDLVDAFHPQTILAWALNDVALPVPNGAPLRLRVERMLGYKHAKYLMAIDAVASLDGIGGGKGGYWEDVSGYEWYAGI